jgi:hypothetical protein
MFGFQQRANMETNKGNDWLEAIVICNYQANCFGNHKELTMDLMGKCPHAPSVYVFPFPLPYAYVPMPLSFSYFIACI